ncbi:MAG: DUF4352 domain-containing protein [Bryobacterales bacterium]|nr:DUF4352 domain-containing protein [Bryobacterales bacterium]
MRTALVLLVACFVTGCGGNREPRVHSVQMGDRVELSPFVYHVIDARWETQLGTDITARLPQHRYLVVKLTAVNSGAAPAPIPGLALEDDAGRTFQESADGAGLADWLGLIRTVKPADMLEGTVVFDVEPRSYRLRLADSDAVRTALVELPLRFDGAPSLSLHDELQQSPGPDYSDWMQNAKRP